VPPLRLGRSRSAISRAKKGSVTAERIPELVEAAVEARHAGDVAAGEPPCAVQRQQDLRPGGDGHRGA
jgi:hypothetical protein